MYDEKGGSFVMANAEDIERMAGLQVGADGWRQLLALLTRFEDKPGRKADAASLVYVENGGFLELRRHVRDRFPRAVLALEALRRTLAPDGIGLKRGLELTGQLKDEPDWLRELLEEEEQRLE